MEAVITFLVSWVFGGFLWTSQSVRAVPKSEGEWTGATFSCCLAPGSRQLCICSRWELVYPGAGALLSGAGSCLSVGM